MLYCEFVTTGVGGCSVFGMPIAAITPVGEQPLFSCSTSLLDQPTALSKSQVPKVYLRPARKRYESDVTLVSRVPKSFITPE